MNTIPHGFNNNLIWNIGHIIVVQQMLVYKLSGLPIMITEEMVEKYRKGTKPELDTTQEEVDALRLLLYATIDQTKTDYSAAVFTGYQEFTTGSGFKIHNATEAIALNSFHESMHIGIMMSLRKFI